MKQIIIIHGTPDKEEYIGELWPSPSNGHWIPWIQKQLNRGEIISQALEMPRPYHPIYKDYVEVFEQMKITNESVLIGHSSGAGFLLRYFSEHAELKPEKIILVAPWIDPEREITTDFFDFVIDKNIIGRTQLHIFMSSDDTEQLSSFAIIEKELPNAIYYRFSDKGHFTEGSLGTKEFPELLEVLK